MRALTRVLVGALVVALVATATAAWFFADRLTALPEPRPFDPDSVVLDADGTTVTLPEEGFAGIDGVWGLQLPDDRHVVMGTDPVRNGDEITRTWSDPVGAPPAPGDVARVDEFVWVGDPSARGLTFEEIAFVGPAGPLPAWWVPTGAADSQGTVVLVHGRGGTREEALRILPTIVGAGWDALVVTYRGDGTAPDPDGGRVTFGTTEWEDLDAAVEWVLSDSRATGEQVVLLGYSMGGAIVAQWLDRAAEADAVDGVVLDAPILSLDALLDLQAGLNRVPEAVEPLLLPAVEVVADLLHDLDSAALEQVAVDGTFADLPILLFHGTEDRFVPLRPSEVFAEARGDQVTFLPVDAGHVRSWNRDPTTYELGLTEFLGSLASASP